MKAESYCRREGGCWRKEAGFSFSWMGSGTGQNRGELQFYPVHCMKLLILDLNLQFLFMTMKHIFENWLIYVSIQWSGCVRFILILGVLINLKWIKVERSTSPFHLKIPWALARTVLHALNLSWEAGEGVELQDKMFSLVRISVLLQ